MTNAWSKIRSKLPKRQRQYDNDASVYLDVIITTKPITIRIEVPHEKGTDVYEVDLSTINANTLYSKIKTQGYYLYTKKKGK